MQASVYTSIFFTLIVFTSQVFAVDFSELAKGQRYKVDGVLPVKANCELQEDGHTVLENSQNINLSPRSATGDFDHLDLTPPYVEVISTDLTTAFWGQTYTIVLSVPNLALSKRDETCTATYTVRQFGEAKPLAISALIND